MLELIRSYAAEPNHVLTFLSLPGRSLLLYPSADVVLIVHARSLILARALAFSDIHPATRHLNASITSLAVDSAMKLIVASLGSRIAAWSLSGVQHDTWRIHSSLTLPESQTITALDCRSGLLAIATSSSLSVYTLILENDLPTWTIKWSTKSSSSPTRVRFSPSLMHIVTTSRQDNTVRVYLTTSGRQTQGIPHPRPVTNIAWRHTQASSRDDLILYTITADSTLRIFLPVLDAPQHLQLHASLDLFSSVHFSLLSPFPSPSSSVFWLDREIMGDALDRILKQHSEPESEDEDEEAKLRIRQLREIQEEGWDLFLRVLPDGAVVVTAVANIDRRPPTLLRHFTLLQTAPRFLSPSATPSHLHILPHPNLGQAKNATQLTLTLIAYPHLTSFELEPKEFFAGRGGEKAGAGGKGGLRVVARGGEESVAEGNERSEKREGSEKAEDEVRARGQESRILRFVRTPDGRAVGVVREKGGEVWTLENDQDRGTRLVRRGKWESADHVVVLDGGRTFATYSNTTNLLTLHTTPPLSITIPRVSSLFSLPPVSGRHECIFGITEVNDKGGEGDKGGNGVPSILHVHATMGSTSEPEEPRLWMHSETTLGGEIGDAMAFILPVDPMAWSGSSGGGSGGRRTETNVAHDVLLGVAKDGDLTFWVPEEGSGGGGGWRRTGRVRTGRRGIRMARCSSAKKTVLVVPSERGEELTIWDSKESEFASGLEYSNIVPNDPSSSSSSSYSNSNSSSPGQTTINDLDWTSTPDGQSILAVGFAHHVDILCQQRMTYFEEGENAAAGWGIVRRIDVREMLPHPISDSIWLAHGALLVGSDRQMCLYGEKSGRGTARQESSTGIGSEPVDEADEPESLFEHVARLNGPLEEYHPQMLLQCLLWEKMELVKEVIVNLAKNVQRARREPGARFVWTEVPVDHFLRKEQMYAAVNGRHRRQYISLFDIPEQSDENEEEGFSRDLVDKLLTQLEEHPLPHLTPNEHAHLLVLIQATLEVDESRRALDANGLRYLISMRSFYILNHRASAPNSPSPNAEPGAARRAAGWRARLRYRDMIWAFHSGSQGLLLTTSVAACEGGKMTWSEARALGVFLWLNGLDAMKSHMEVIARNEYMANDARDPVACSLFYFALGKSKLVHGLWRQAAWHKEQQVMLKFLNNDFRQARWRTAAMKNAFALLSKRRFEYAAAFFILGGSLKDAVNVCIKQLNDFQLAVALCRIVEQSDEGPILQGVLNGTVIPLAFKSGNRWLASWAFWLLRRRDLAVRILVMPLQDIATSFSSPAIMEIGSPHYDDPSLALLFSQLKAKTLQTAKGTSEISGRLEFNFILQIARVFTKMGCHVLALDLVRSWSFDRPSTVSHDPPTSHPHEAPPSPTSARRLFALGPAMRRRSSILIDMDVSTQPPTRRPSPEPVEQNPNASLTTTINLNGDGAQSRISLSLSMDGEGGVPIRDGEEKMKEDEGDLVARKAGMGSLMKSAKHDVQVPEFDMNAFF